MESFDQGYAERRFSAAVDEDLHCPICLNVLKDPVQCQANEHHFCTPCIMRHLRNFRTCPSCMEELSVEELKKPARFLTKHLGQLNICCDHENRGCPEIVKLEDLRAHVATCGFAPVKCSNDGCREVINGRERIRHETEICEFRRAKCHDCVEVRKEISELKTSFEELKVLVCQMMVEIKGCANPRSDICHSSDNDSKEDIIVVGGYDGDLRLRSAEMFVWSKMKWLPLNHTKEPRSGSSSVIYKNQLLVAGGRTGDNSFTDTIEVLFIDKPTAGWYPHPVKLPFPCSGHNCIIYQDSLLLIGGLNGFEDEVSSGIYEIRLSPPYCTKRVSSMPQARHYHGTACVGDQIVISGGQTNTHYNHDSVLLFNVKTKKCYAGFPLLYPVLGMATVSWGENVVLMGGENNGELLNTAMVYNFKTGDIHMLPPMKHKRSFCTAVTTKNIIIVIGGFGKDGILDTVEYFSFASYSWIELPLMNEKRTSPSAVVRPGNMMTKLNPLL